MKKPPNALNPKSFLKFDEAVNLKDIESNVRAHALSW